MNAANASSLRRLARRTLVIRARFDADDLGYIQVFRF